MKNLCFLFSFFGLGFSANAQIVNIPDANFKNALVNSICANGADEPFVVTDVDTNDDGEIQVSEALAIQNLFVSLPPHLPGENTTGMIPLGISDLTGIEAFLNLKRLDISQNQLTALDVSMLTQLRSLDCRENQLTSLILGNNTALISAGCANNQLTTLDISGTPNLSFLTCHSNALTAIDVSGMASLMQVSCSNNQITLLTFGNNPILTHVYADDNLFESVDLSDTGVQLLHAQNNPNLISVNVKNGVISPIGLDTTPFDPPAFKFMGSTALTHICADADEVSNIMVNLNSQPVLVTPYCNFTPGGSYNTIAGTLAIDCGGENLPMAIQKVAMTDGEVNWIAFTNTDGHYAQYIGESDVTLTPILEIPEYFSLTPESYEFAFTSTGNTQTADFCATPTGNHPDVEV